MIEYLFQRTGKVSKMLPRDCIAICLIITNAYIRSPKGDKLSEKIKVVYDGVRKGW